MDFMKKIFGLMAAALMSVTLLAGENDLQWDFTEAGPSSSPVVAQNNPDAKLYFNNKLNDAAGTNNGLKGLKMNSSGYGAFKKAPVAGNLRLSFGPRSGSNETYLEVWNCEWDGETPKQGTTKIATTGKQSAYGTQIIHLTAEQNDIYLYRGKENSTETGLQVIDFREDVPRTFVDFTIDFREDPPIVSVKDCALPEGCNLPEGVWYSSLKYNGNQHGVYGPGTINIPVDGPVKFTIGVCQFSTGLIKVIKDGQMFVAMNNNMPCGETTGHFDQFITWTYTEGPATLQFYIPNNTYLPYLIAEACEITPCQVIFKDWQGNELGRIDTYEGATLFEIPYTEEDMPQFPDAMAFRGWYYSNGVKASAGDGISGNTVIQAKVTPIEYATVGSVQTYNFMSNIFYPEDHETVEVNGGYFHDPQHGWAFIKDEEVTVDVAGNAVVVLTICEHGNENGEWAIINTADNSELGTVPACVKNKDAEQISFKYTGEATELKLQLRNSNGENYLHKVVVYNVLDFMEKDENVGYYIIPKNDVASFLLALTEANATGNAKIFLPDGLYDLGETVLTAISGNNISIIGESMEKTIIRNAPPTSKESIDQTATIKILKNVKGTYLQDLTIQNALDYYSTGSSGRAVCLQDCGTQTICKNVRLLSYQDTYYSNLQGAVKYFEDCEIHGTVDFICGDGSVYFKNNLLYAEKRQSNGGGSDALTASNAEGTKDRGYVFESCTVKSECPVVSFGRAWNNKPQTIFLNTLVDYSAGEFGFENSDIQRWTKKLMNKNAWPQFGEFNTHLTNGTVITPASNVVTFIDEKNGNATQEIETILSAEKAASFTMAYTLGEWAETAQNDAKQAIAEKTASEFEPDGIYLVEGDGEFKAIIRGSEFMERFALYDGVTYTVRKANARGGFGLVAGEDPDQAIENTGVCNCKIEKKIVNGQLVIVRNDKEFNALGIEVR